MSPQDVRHFPISAVYLLDKREKQQVGSPVCPSVSILKMLFSVCCARIGTIPLKAC